MSSNNVKYFQLPQRLKPLAAEVVDVVGAVKLNAPVVGTLKVDVAVVEVGTAKEALENVFVVPPVPPVPPVPAVVPAVVGAG